MGAYIVLIGLAGLLLGAWVGGTDLAFSWAVTGGILGYALALGRRIQELRRRVADLTAQERPRQASADPAHAATSPLAPDERLAIDRPPSLSRPLLPYARNQRRPRAPRRERSPRQPSASGNGSARATRWSRWAPSCSSSGSPSW